MNFPPTDVPGAAVPTVPTEIRTKAVTIPRDHSDKYEAGPGFVHAGTLSTVYGTIPCWDSPNFFLSYVERNLSGLLP